MHQRVMSIKTVDLGGRKKTAIRLRRPKRRNDWHFHHLQEARERARDAAKHNGRKIKQQLLH